MFNIHLLVDTVTQDGIQDPRGTGESDFAEYSRLQLALFNTPS